MKTLKKVQWQLVLSIFIILLFGVNLHTVQADEGVEQEFEYGYCTDITLADIPYGDFSHFVWPQAKQDGTPVSRITQQYNQPKGVDDWSKSHWGHDGNDFHEYRGLAANVNNNIAIQGGKIIVSMWGLPDTGWGYRMAIATRVPYSHQILTFHYAHMVAKSLKFGKCAIVQQGDIIGREGDTGYGNAAHLHLTVRIWDSLKELKAALKLKGSNKGLFQDGYSYGNDAYLANYLSPYNLLTDKFNEFGCNDEGCPLWAKSHALAARRKGIDFGRFDGYFAVNPTPKNGEDPIDLLKKGESARWFTVARRYLKDQSKDSSVPFTDVSEGNIYFPYIAELLDNGVLSSIADCNSNQQGLQFCSNSIRTRAELLKMIVMTFLRDEFETWLVWDELGVYDPYFEGIINGAHFQDMYDLGGNGWHWGTKYVLFAAFSQLIPNDLQLVDINLNFRPDDPINKLEAVKLLMIAREYFFMKYGEDTQYTLCDYHYCPVDQKCVVLPEEGEEDQYITECIDIPSCIPEESGKTCEYGGGLNDPCDNPECTPGVTKNQPCGNGGTQTAICTDECDWGSWGDCEGSGPCNPGQTLDCGYCGTMTCGSTNQWGSCQNQGSCSPGQTQQQSCNGSGIQTATCTNQCQWGAWSSCSCECSSGVCCDGCNYKSSSVVCDSWYDYRCEGFNQGDDVERRGSEQRCSGTSISCNGITNYGGWQTYQNCNSSEVCDDNYSPPQCVNGCTDTHYWNSPLDMETDNYGQQATQEINVAVRVEVQEDAQGLEFRVCKEGTFTDDVYFSIYDAMTNSSAGRTFTILSTAGKVCSNWMSMINDNNYLEGEVFGGTWKVVSPASSEPDWPNYSCVVNGSPTGTCWSGINITLTRTCL